MLKKQPECYGSSPSPQAQAENGCDDCSFQTNCFNEPKYSQVKNTLKERGKRYGDFFGHAVICQDIKNQMNNRKGWSRLTPDKKQALEVIADKIARILNGNPEYTDNWHDIAGYATLAEQRCKAT